MLETTAINKNIQVNINVIMYATITKNMYAVGSYQPSGGINSAIGRKNGQGTAFPFMP